ncbi:MAG: EAL domain-containing protein, partial [Ferrovum sp.]|nr:EAL domain-containing protein [Ferrovum sp.]
GADPDFLRDNPISLSDDDPAGPCQTGRAIRESRPVWCQDYQEDPHATPLHKISQGFNWRSGAVLPLYRNGIVVGVFTLYSDKPGAFIEPIRKLLDEMASDISYALDIFARELERNERERQLNTLSAAVRQSPASVIIADLEGNIQYVNPKFEQVSGYQSAEVVGKNPRILSSGEKTPEDYRALWATITSGGTWQGVLHNRRKDGSLFWEQVSISPILDDQGRPVNYVAVKEDITERRAAEEEMHYLAFYDVLTQLPNRRLLVDRLQKAMATCSRNHRGGALLLIDLDNFKTLNDTLGHAVGDLLLQQVARRLVACVREVDTVARLGGDEFVVMLEDLDGPPHEVATAVTAVCEKILSTLNQPYVLSGYGYTGTPSIGVTLFSDRDNTVDLLLKQADLAMYQAKAMGRNMLRFFDPEMQVMIMKRAMLEAELRQGIQEDQYLLHFQPKVSCVTGRITGFEALLRWQHPVRGLTGPGEFVQVLEETGLIVPVGAWVLTTACSQMKRWHDAGLGTPTVSVNISGKQIHNITDLSASVQAALTASGLAPRYLELELTESQLMNDAERDINLLQRLKEMGVKLSVDDFGTGYSSLAYLKRFPIDSLKIDRAFVQDIVADPNDVSITRAIITLAHNLKLKVVAEGVETGGQLDLLIANQCDEIQGYYFSRPLSIEEAEALLISGRSLDSGVRAGAPNR